MRYELSGTGKRSIEFPSLAHLVNYLEQADGVTVNRHGLLRVYKQHVIDGPLRMQGRYIVQAKRVFGRPVLVTPASVARIVRLSNQPRQGGHHE